MEMSPVCNTCEVSLNDKYRNSDVKESGLKEDLLTRVEKGCSNLATLLKIVCPRALLQACLRSLGQSRPGDRACCRVSLANTLRAVVNHPRNYKYFATTFTRVTFASPAAPPDRRRSESASEERFPAEYRFQIKLQPFQITRRHFPSPRPVCRPPRTSRIYPPK
ncbi:hypothetical protein EVAR_48410_1 [Eumeta japonica]|uniref:Uncharacterized protein n=1 Tax=Eumeta variegata TaxID=151549 RepID=A0A4C1XU45_EUMVA|nr:hypothetical protein EVAR_48410_1 [Eumeta japonica]